MPEREPPKETIGRGDLYFLAHPETEQVFSGYGLTTRPGYKNFLVGLLMVDRPEPADPEWLQQVEATFGDYQLVAMTATGERGIVCQIQVEPESLPYVRPFPIESAAAIQAALQPLLESPPKPIFTLHWDEQAKIWQSQLASPNELPDEIKEIFANQGYGCLPLETSIGIVHICHAPDTEIDGFADKPVWYQWQLIKMPTSPLIRLEVVVMDNPLSPFRFESFLNVAEADQLNVLTELASQSSLYLTFYGAGLNYRFTKVLEHDEQQWQQLDELVAQATDYWNALPLEQRDFNQAKAMFMRLDP